MCEKSKIWKLLIPLLVTLVIITWISPYMNQSIFLLLLRCQAWPKVVLSSCLHRHQEENTFIRQNMMIIVLRLQPITLIYPHHTCLINSHMFDQLSFCWKVETLRFSNENSDNSKFDQEVSKYVQYLFQYITMQIHICMWLIVIQEKTRVITYEYWTTLSQHVWSWILSRTLCSALSSFSNEIIDWPVKK
jgi:hypothetical protein